MKNRTLIFLLTAIILGSCAKKKNTTSSDLWFLAETNEENVTGWEEYSKLFYSCKIPPSFILVESKDYMFSASLDSLDENSYLVSKSFSKVDNDITLLGFLELIKNQLENDTIENLELGEYYAINQDNKLMVFSTINTSIANVDYRALTYYFEMEGYIFDFTTKVKKSSISLDEQGNLFLNFLKHFKVTEKPILHKIEEGPEIKKVIIE